MANNRMKNDKWKIRCDNEFGSSKITQGTKV